MRKRLFGVLLVFAVAGFLYTLRQIDDVTLTTPEQVAKVPRYTINDAVMTRYDTDGQPSMHGTAATVEYFEDESAEAETMVVDLPGRSGKPWHVTAPKASMPAHTKTFLLQGDVNARGNWPDSGEPVTVHTQELWVELDPHEMHTTSTMTFDSPNRNGSSVGFNSNWVKGTLNMLDDVKMHYEIRHQ